MINIKSDNEIALMRISGQIVKNVLELLGEKIRPGMKTIELDKIAYEYIIKQNAKPSFLGYGGFPGSVCVSIDDEIIHGIPGDKIIEEGQLVSVDVGAYINGYHGDAARTFAIGQVDELKQKLLEVTQESFFKGIEQFKEGNRLGDISYAIQQHIESNGFSVVKQYTGHGIGKNLHEDPSVLNYGTAGRGIRLKQGLVIAIEPMVNAGTDSIRVLQDGWTVVTKDGLPAAHYENTVALTENGVEILTL